jgi:hypothetical protein
MVPTPNQANTVHTTKPYSPFYSTLPPTPGLLSGLFPSGIPTQIMYPVLISNMRATYPAHIILPIFP